MAFIMYALKIVISVEEDLHKPVKFLSFMGDLFHVGCYHFRN